MATATVEFDDISGARFGGKAARLAGLRRPARPELGDPGQLKGVVHLLYFDTK